MLERFGIEPRDRRNLVVVMAIMALILMLVAEGPVPVRVVVGLVGGTISGVVFLVVTAVTNAHRPG